MKRLKTLAVLLVLAILFVLIVQSCGDNSDNNSPNITGGIRLRYAGNAIPSTGLEVDIFAGTTVTFTAVDENNKDVDFTLDSSDIEVATASGKTVTLIMAGETSIKAAAKADTNNTHTIKLIVNDTTPHTVTVTGGTWDGGSATGGKAVVGDIITLSAEDVIGFDHWTITPASTAMLTKNSFRMPPYDVKVTYNAYETEPGAKAPYFITNNYGQDASSELMVQWHQDLSVDLQQNLEIVRAADSFDNATNLTVTGAVFSQEDAAPLYIGSFPARNLYRKKVTALEPDTLYKYRMGEEGKW
jgi:hypothetical protein